MTKRLLIVQPYVPKYRVPFFDALVHELARTDIQCIVIAGAPQGNQAARNDGATAEWLSPVTRREIRLGRASLSFSRFGRLLKAADGIIVGLEGTSIDTYRALAGGHFGNLRVGLWGHVASYVSLANPLDTALERWQMRHSDEIFAYTTGGQKVALAAGIDSEKITVLMNTVDTNAVRSALETVNDADVQTFIREQDLQGRRVVAFIGGLDESKRIAFLAQALEQMWETAPDIVMLVGGKGALAHLLDDARARGQIRDLGYVGPSEKAILAKVSRAILMPGRIGLVAVEALVLQIPIVTTDWPFHAPESEYLIEGESRFTAKDNVTDFVHTTLGVLDRGRSRQAADWEYPRLEDMVKNFAGGARRMMS